MSRPTTDQLSHHGTYPTCNRALVREPDGSLFCLESIRPTAWRNIVSILEPSQDWQEWPTRGHGSAKNGSALLGKSLRTRRYSSTETMKEPAGYAYPPQGWQLPPQSTPVSSPSITSSLQESGRSFTRTRTVDE